MPLAKLKDTAPDLLKKTLCRASTFTQELKIITVAILAQGTHRAVATSQALLATWFMAMTITYGQRDHKRNEFMQIVVDQ